MGNRINTVMQPCFFQLSGVLPAEEAIARIKAFVEQDLRASAATRSSQRNFAAIDRVARSAPPGAARPDRRRACRCAPLVPDRCPDFVREVTARLMAGDGDLLPVSALPVDGTFPSGTAKYEKRAIAPEIPVWDPAICIDCGKCAIVCPHATIRMKVYPTPPLPARAGFLSKAFKSQDLPGHRLTIQVAPDDCTGCGVCVDVCPAKSKTEVGHKAINMAPDARAPRRASAAAGTTSRRSAPLDRAADPPRHGQGRAACSSRCSSSPARAPAAARRRT